ncbi:hypothetical protein NPIL_609001 [Nephila pilipes]|uniref:Uncharacterized protein n=1 Tax=Nephila pilipes TaxID=299642 RepID=A0A8X6PZK8_NEPPI|nr:hypothetical protein NPIL_609001 [Nephila pilipes]
MIRGVTGRWRDVCTYVYVTALLMLLLRKTACIRHYGVCERRRICLVPLNVFAFDCLLCYLRSVYTCSMPRGETGERRSEEISMYHHLPLAESHNHACLSVCSLSLLVV